MFENRACVYLPFSCKTHTSSEPNDFGQLLQSWKVCFGIAAVLLCWPVVGAVITFSFQTNLFKLGPQQGLRCGAALDGTMPPPFKHCQRHNRPKALATLKKLKECLLKMVWNGKKVGQITFLTPLPPWPPHSLEGVGGVKKTWWFLFLSQNGLKWRENWSDHLFYTMAPLRKYVVSSTTRLLFCS